MRLILLPYKPGSKGAIKVAETLKLEMVPKDAPFQTNEPTKVLNWGRGDFPGWHPQVTGWINDPSAVMRAIDKMVALARMKQAGVPVPDFTTDIEVARTWLAKKETIAVFCRQELQGREGNGIIVARTEAQVEPAKLFTKYARKVQEYRVHVMDGEVFYVNRKSPARGGLPAGSEQLVRSGAQGWRFVHLDPHEYPSEGVLSAARGAVHSLGLDFGGVDVGEGQDGIKVYEVNSAPEVGDNTMAAYKAAFKKHYGDYTNNENVKLGAL